MNSLTALRRHLHQVTNFFNVCMLILHSLSALSVALPALDRSLYLNSTPQMQPHLLFVTLLLMLLPHLDAPNFKVNLPQPLSFGTISVDSDISS